MDRRIGFITHQGKKFSKSIYQTARPQKLKNLSAQFPTT
jgi:hypothetical protein